jgi:hypothetical protein
MTSKHRSGLILALAMIVGALVSVADATPVTDFRTYRSGTANGTAPALSGQGTNDPVVGDLSGNPASAGVVLGYLDTPATLGANVGDKVTFSFTARFNDAVGLDPSGDNFRFALFDLNGEAEDSATGGLNGGPTYATAGTDNTDQFRGFWLGNFGGGGAGNAGSIRQRLADLDSSTDNPFTNNMANPAIDIGTVSGDNVVLTSDVNGDGAGFDYTGTLTLTRAGGGLIDVSGTFVGSNKGEGETDNIFMSDASVNGSSTYGAVGFLIGNPLSVDQVLFTDIDVAVMPAGGVPGDFNGDTKVDDADFAVWKNDFGTSKDGDDFLVWQQNYGTGVTPAAAVAGAVPEPGAAVLAGLALVWVGARRRGGRR